MCQYKVLFLDIDGTMIRPDNTIEDSTIKAVQQAQQKGIEVFLATGRPLHELKEIADLLNVNSFIGYNGAYVVYKGVNLYQEIMKPDMIQRFLEITLEHNHDAVMYTDEKNVFTKLHTPVITEFIEKFQLHHNEEYSPSKIYDVLGMTLINLEESAPALYDYDESVRLSQVHVHGMTHCYDVIQERVNKGVGIQFLLNHLGIKRESAIAFGDGMNDKEMLSSVGEGIAMGNAHPDLFQYAKHKTTDVSNSGIYNGLKMLGIIEE